MHPRRILAVLTAKLTFCAAGAWWGLITAEDQITEDQSC